MQTTMNLSTKEELKNSWAFAVCPGQFRASKRLNIGALEKSYISSCSRQARLLGIREGMPYHEARETLPGLKILVIKGGASR